MPDQDNIGIDPTKGFITKYGKKLLTQSGLKYPGSKIFVLFSAGTRLADITNGIQPWLNVEAEYFDWKMKLVLEGMAWLDPKEYVPFLDDAQVGDMIVLKEMIGLVCLRFPKDEEDSPVWNRK